MYTHPEHTPPPCQSEPDDVTQDHIRAQVDTWLQDATLIHHSIARAIAALWATPTMPALTAFAFTGALHGADMVYDKHLGAWLTTTTADLLGEIRQDIGACVPGTQGAQEAGQLMALYEYVTAAARMAYA